MNRQEIIERLKLIQAGLTQDDNNKSKNRIDAVIEELEKPITLVDFLGWKENVEYNGIGDRYKIVDNKLYVFVKWLNDWQLSSFIDAFVKLQQAKKVIPKKHNVILKSVYIKLFELKDEQKYLTLDIKKDTFFHSKYSTNNPKYIPDNSKYQAQFTLEEIRKIKEKRGIDLSMYDIVEVQE